MLNRTRLAKNLVAAAFLLQFVVGCGGSADGLPREAVKGSVAIEGKPLNKGLITFLPDSPDVSTQSGAMIVDGKFDIPKAQGLVPGKYKVVITSPEDKGVVVTDTTNNAPGMAPVIVKEVVPREYNAESKLTAEIKAGSSTPFDFNLISTSVSSK